MDRKTELNERFRSVGLALPQMLIPAADPEKFACVACDQYTSQPEYWERVEKYVGDTPSSLNLMMPEAWLGMEERASHAEEVPQNMQKYLDGGVFKELPPGFIFIKRETLGGVRRGLMANIALADYEYKPGNKALIRATEGTVEERLPVRIEIRKRAPLEMPHVMVLINDKEDLLMNALEKMCEAKAPLYDFELMENSGRLTGWFIGEDAELEKILAIIEDKLLPQARDGMLYAVGDGNHSLAAAKKCGDEFALVELVNLYDPALVFHPIHRLVKDGQVVDYIHGERECRELAERLGCEAVIMPDYPKDRLFDDVIENGVLPKKSFSMGEAQDKRFYFECRRLR